MYYLSQQTIGFRMLLIILTLIFFIGCSGGGGGGNGDDDDDPQPTITETTIGPDGGMLEVKDSSSPIYGARIDIPAGALSEDTTFSIVEAEVDDNSDLVSIPIAVQHNQVDFLKEVEITIPLKESLTETQNLMVMFYDETEQQFVPSGLVYNISEGSTLAKVKVPHYSTISLSIGSYIISKLISRHYKLLLLSAMINFKDALRTAMYGSLETSMQVFINSWSLFDQMASNIFAYNLVKGFTDSVLKRLNTCPEATESCFDPINQTLNALIGELMDQKYQNICEELDNPVSAFYPGPDAKEVNRESNYYDWDLIENNNYSVGEMKCLGRCGGGCPGDPQWLNNPFTACSDLQRYTQACFNHDVCCEVYATQEGKDCIEIPQCDLIFPPCIDDCREAPLCNSSGEGLCHDGKDNDGDGLIDSEDDNCDEGNLLIRSQPIEHHVEPSVSIHNYDCDISRLSIIMPLAESNIYQEVKNLSTNVAEIIQINNSNDHYLRFLIEDSFPEKGETKEWNYEFDAVLYDIDTNFSLIRNIFGYDKNSSIYIENTKQIGSYVDPNNDEIISIGSTLWAQSDDILEYANLCYEYVSENFEYKNPNTGIHPLVDILENGGGDCGNLTSIFVSLLRYQGIPARHLISVRPDGSYHVFGDFYLEGYGWIPVDVTMKLFYPNDDYFGIIKSEHSGIIFTKNVGTIVNFIDNQDYQLALLQNYAWMYWCNSGADKITSGYNISSGYYEGEWSGWMGASSYQNVFDDNNENDYYPLKVEGRRNGTQSQYRGYFQPYWPAPFWFWSRHGVNLTQFNDDNTQLTNQGYMLIWHQTFTDYYGTTRHQATWVKLD